ncbi:AAA family ATPase [Streptomyces phaeochromogenes]
MPYVSSALHDAQLTELRAAFDRSASGRTVVALIEGAAGCGKTHVLDALAAHAAAAGALVLTAHPSPDQPEPLGALRHLSGLAQLPAETAYRLRRSLVPNDPDAARRLRTELHDVARQRPVLLCLDDLHHTDDATLCHLLPLATCPAPAPVLLLLTRLSGGDPRQAGRVVELLRATDFLRVRLDRPTSREAAGRLPDGWYELTGGNPLLLRALAEDQHHAGQRATDHGCRVAPVPIPAPMSVPIPAPMPVSMPAPIPAPVPGDLYVEAALTCVRRAGHLASAVAGGIALLGAYSSPGLLGRLLELGPDETARGLAALDAAGLLDGLALRHPSVAEALCAVTAARSGRDGELILRAAELLHQDGAPAADVARRLLGARPADRAWTVPVLRDAAAQALGDDDVDLALSCLERARTQCADDDKRTGITIDLARATARLTPAAAERLLDGPLHALRTGRLSAAHTGALVRLLAAQGRVGEIHAAREPDMDADRPRLVPSVRDRAPTTPDGPCAPPPMPMRMPPTRRAVSLLGAGPRTDGLPGHDHGVDPPGSVDAARQLLAVTPLTDTTFDALTSAVRTLTHAGHPREAAARCRNLTTEAERRGAPGWYAVLTALHAELALYRGDLAGAAAAATEALDAVRDRHGGVFAGGPLATRILARTASGDYRAAARDLAVAVPEALPHSLHGLRYARARGRFHLATHHAAAALDEFLTVGETAHRWGTDRPALLPWRVDAAEAWLALDAPDRAEQLLSAQLTMPGFGGDPRVRGRCLRLLAPCAPADRRPRLLARAVRELRLGGDRLELARALADLSRILRATGEYDRARTVAHRARRIARECGAEALLAELGRATGPAGRPGAETAEPSEALTLGLVARAPGPAPRPPLTEAVTRLSASEARVAGLAVEGRTNREIAHALHITASTVEQHLTRVFRKLDIRSRRELAPVLRPRADTVA